MIKLKWTKKKPKFGTRSKECLLIAATKFNKRWDYHLYQIKKTDCDDKWYWGIFDQYGDEWGEYSDLQAQRYAIINPITDLK